MVKSARDSEASRRKIIDVSIQLFARKGFDGARVDEIALEAGVNKALIYYYFKSKSLILEEIFNEFYKQTTDLIFERLNERIAMDDSDWVQSFFNAFLDFLENRKSILKIMLTESLKSGPGEPPLFGLLRLIFQGDTVAALESARSEGFVVDEQMDQIMVTEFFTNIIPVISYIVFKDKWCRSFDVSKDNLREMFFKAYHSTHIDHHLPHDSEKGNSEE